MSNPSDPIGPDIFPEDDPRYQYGDAWMPPGPREPVREDIRTKHHEANGYRTPPPPPEDRPKSFALIPCPELRAVPDEQLWLWHGVLGRGVVTLFSALMKAGKTTLLAHLLK